MNKRFFLRRIMKQALAAVLCLFLFTDGITALAAESVSNPRMVEVDTSYIMAEKITTWTCIYFGSYPQTEIVQKAEDCGTHGKKFENVPLWNGGKYDYEENSELYSSLESAQGWNQYGDITLDGTKYRRIKQSDASFSSTGENYYSWNNTDSYHYFRYEPIKWRVLHVDGTKALLLADQVLDTKPYNTTKIAVTWETCTLRSWLNGYGNTENTVGIDYSYNNFKDTAFSSEEQAAIETTMLDNSTTSDYAAEYGGNDTEDKVYLLAQYDLCKTDQADSYGFRKRIYWEDEGVFCQGSTYADAMGVYNNVTYDSYNEDLGPFNVCNWFIRSPGNSSLYVDAIFWYGMVDSIYNTVNQYGVRPALTLDLSSSVWSGACSVCNDGSISDGHIWDDGVITEAATCGKAGVKTYTCSNCGETKTEVIPAKEHSWGTGVITKKATCVKAGVKTYTCSNCGKTKTEAIPATGQHKAVKDKAVAATVFATGKTAGSHCSVCGKVITAQKTVAKLKPTIKLSAAKKTLKTKKSYTLVISKLAKGDSIKSVKSSKTSYVSVKKISTTKYKITAKKKGKAYVTVTLKSKKTAKCLVTVK